MRKELRSILLLKGRDWEAKVQELLLLFSLDNENLFFKLAEFFFNKLIMAWVFVEVVVDEGTKLVNTQQSFNAIY